MDRGLSQDRWILTCNRDPRFWIRTVPQNKIQDRQKKNRLRGLRPRTPTQGQSFGMKLLVTHRFIDILDPSRYLVTRLIYSYINYCMSAFWLPSYSLLNGGTSCPFSGFQISSCPKTGFWIGRMCPRSEILDPEIRGILDSG